jgi:hypothetical protein
MYNFQLLGLKQFQGGPVSFPCRATIQVELGPLAAFGAADEPGRTLIPEREALVEYNADSGRMRIRPKPPLERIADRFQLDSDEFVLEGNVLTYTADYAMGDELGRSIQAFLFGLPPLLTLRFADPPFVRRVRIIVGDAAFRLEHVAAYNPLRAATAISRRDEIRAACLQLALFNKIENRRLLRALQYFHTAQRLVDAGNNDWEFMAEAILNLAKVLEVLFKQSENWRDEIRNELRTLGYGDDQIERDFITVVFLRNSFDVGHPRLLSFPQTDLQILYAFLSNVFPAFSTLLSRILEKVERGEYSVRQSRNERVEDSNDSRTWETIINNIRSRLPPPPTPGASPTADIPRL